MFLDICQNSGFLSTILLAKRVLDIIRFAAPIILILLCAIDLSKQVLNPDEKKGNYPRIIKRAIAAVAIFFIPTIVSLLLNLLGTQNFKETTCWLNANTGTIAVLSAQEKAERKAAEEARKKENEQANAEREERERNREKIRESKEKEASSTLLEENGEDGQITVVDGVFYKPCNGVSGVAGTRGSAPYGYVTPFYNRLKAFTDAASKAGYSVWMSTSEYGAWRPYANQEYFYNCYINQNCNNGNLAAVPGVSNHGWGIASDLSFGGDYNASVNWAHTHASEYGLHFPIASENWHIEPTEVKCK